MKLQNDPCLGGGSLPQANADWVAKANSADSVFGSKPDFVVSPKGQVSYRGTTAPLPATGIKALESPMVPRETSVNIQSTPVSQESK